MVKTNASGEAMRKLLSKIRLAATSKFRRKKFKSIQSFWIFFLKALFYTFREVLRFGLSTPPSADEHQYLAGLTQPVINDAPNRMALQTLEATG